MNLLLQRGAYVNAANPEISLDVNAPYIDRSGEKVVKVNALDYVMNRIESEEMTRLLLVNAKSLNLNLQDEQTKKTALMNAIHNDRLGLVKVFVETVIHEKAVCGHETAGQRGKETYLTLLDRMQRLQSISRVNGSNWRSN